jgi:hypothetical protein
MNEITAYHLTTTDNPELQVASLEEPDLTENEIVAYDEEGHTGVILDVHTEDFTWEADGEEHSVEASSEDPVYAVALETGGTGLFADEDLDQVPQDDAFGDIDVDAVSEVEGAELGQAYANLDDCTDCVVEELSVNVPFAEDPGVGWADYPDSWEESEKPNRLILLDMWSSMGGTFRGCRREMAGRIRNPNKFCGATKDEVYQTTQWRDGGD